MDMTSEPTLSDLQALFSAALAAISARLPLSSVLTEHAECYRYPGPDEHMRIRVAMHIEYPHMLDFEVYVVNTAENTRIDDVLTLWNEGDALRGGFRSTGYLSWDAVQSLVMNAAQGQQTWRLDAA